MSSAHFGELDSPEVLAAKYNEKRKEIRGAILGSNPETARCGYIDTSDGCVMTSERAMQLAEEKYLYDKANNDAESMREAERAVKDAHRRELH